MVNDDTFTIKNEDLGPKILDQRLHEELLSKPLVVFSENLGKVASWLWVRWHAFSQRAREEQCYHFYDIFDIK